MRLARGDIHHPEIRGLPFQVSLDNGYLGPVWRKNRLVVNRFFADSRDGFAFAVEHGEDPGVLFKGLRDRLGLGFRFFVRGGSLAPPLGRK
jgi:hypothetical protein